MGTLLPGTRETEPGAQERVNKHVRVKNGLFPHGMPPPLQLQGWGVHRASFPAILCPRVLSIEPWAKQPNVEFLSGEVKIEPESIIKLARHGWEALRLTGAIIEQRWMMKAIGGHS
jgi:hypothetical protein